MKYYVECSLQDFPGWSGADNTLAELTVGETEQLESYINEMMGDSIWEECELNDYLRFGKDEIAQFFGYVDWESFLEREIE